jgi:putative sterol carrier protein
MDGPPLPGRGGVFISYRRQDTAAYARLLREELSRRLGAQQVFMDVDSIEVGVDFAEAIQRAVGECEVLLALVGLQWLTASDAEGQRRLDDPDDIVRLEIEAGLAREIRVIPVLVDDTPMPRSQELPDSLAPLARRNALKLSSDRYAFDMGRLLHAIEGIVARAAASSETSVASAPEEPGADVPVAETPGVSPAPLRSPRADDTPKPLDLPTLSALIGNHSDKELIAAVQSQVGGVTGVLDRAFAGMADSFNPAKAGGQQGSVQYEITAPDTTHEYFMRVAKGRCEVGKGRIESPRATVRMPLPDYLRLITGGLKGMIAFMTGKLKVDGDLFFVQTFQAWFDPIE